MLECARYESTQVSSLRLDSYEPLAERKEPALPELQPRPDTAACKGSSQGKGEDGAFAWRKRPWARTRGMT
jgi:hypothetical protein